MSPPASAVGNEQRSVKKSSTCTNCRERHLKCDGNRPCSRCKVERTDCEYVPSRRGQRKPSSSLRRQDPVAALSKDGPRGSNTTIWTTPIVSGVHPPDFSVTMEERPPSTTAQPQSPTNKPERSRTAISVHLLGLFYAYFFQSHPFVLPRAHLSEKFAKSESPQLQAAVEYVGACYDLTCNRAEHMEIVSRRLFLTSPPRDGFTVQAMLLTAIALNANNEQERAREILRRAVSLAMEVGMHLPSFAATYGDGDPVLEESWRRTFWELFIVERALAAEACNLESILITQAPLLVPLPCEESEYLGGNVYRHRTLDDYDNRAFLGENIIFPSYAYRIDASRIIASALPLAFAPYPEETYIQKVDYELAQWCLYLPTEKRRVVSDDDRCDEVLFHAHALAFWAGMLLHRPRSTLARSRLLNPVLDCSPLIPSAAPVLAQSAPYHTAFVLKAADSIVKLGNMPRSTLTHTPLFNFILLLSASTHLAIWPHVKSGQRQGSTPAYASSSSDPTRGDGSGRSSVLSGTGSDDVKPFMVSFEDDPNNFALGDISASTSSIPDQAEIKDRLRLLLGSLKRLSPIWPSAKIAMEEVQAFSMQLFTSTSKSSPAGDSMYEAGSSSTDTMSQHTSTGIPVAAFSAPMSSTMQSPSVTLPQSNAPQSTSFNMFEALNQAGIMPLNYYGASSAPLQASYTNTGSISLDFGDTQQYWQAQHDDLEALVDNPAGLPPGNLPTSLG